MFRSHLRTYRETILALVVMATLAVLATIALFHLRDASNAEERRLRQEAALAGQIAQRLEWPLQRLQEGLAHLAAHPARNALPGGEVGGLELIFHDLPPQLLLALYVRDTGNRLLAEYPTGSLTRNSVYRQLLGTVTPSFAPHVFSDDDPSLLLLHQPLAGGDGEIGALINLRRFVATALADLSGQASFGFLVDAQGSFLLHNNPALDGQPATANAAPDQEVPLQTLLRQACRQPVPRISAAMTKALLPVAISAAETQRALNLTPLHVGASRWSLGLVFPARIATPPLISPAWLTALLFCCAAAAGLLAVRLRRLAKEQNRLQESRGALTRSLTLTREAFELATRRYHHLLDHAGDALFFIDPGDGSLQQLNHQAQELFGYRPEEIHTLSLAVLFPGQQRRRFLRLMRTVRRHGYGEADDLVFRRKDGRLFTGAVHARLGRLGDQEVVHGVVRDVSERKRMEQELRQRNRDLTLLNEVGVLIADSSGLPDMLRGILKLLVDSFAADGGGVYLARESGTRLRLDAHCGVGPELLKLLAEIPRETGLVGRVMASGHPKAATDLQRDRRIHFEALRSAGWCSLQAVPLSVNEQTVGVFFLFATRPQLYPREAVRLLTAVGRQMGTAVHGANLFEALQWQNRLTQASNRELELSRQKLRETLGRVTESKRALEHLDRMKSQFLALASHELRTPLTYVLSGSELLSERLSQLLDADGRTALSAVRQGGLRLNDVVQDLLEVARLQAQDLYLRREPVRPRDLLLLLREEFAGRLAERQLQMAINDFPEAVHLFGDPHHLKRTFGRLLENALKFTPAGGQIEISGRLQSREQIQARREQLRPFSPRFFNQPPAASLLQVSIRDTGVGIDPDEQLRIFDTFYEVGEVAGHFTSTSRFGGKGAGLGLALVKGVIEAHGGMVWVESAGTAGHQAGSAFHLILPALPGEPAAVLPPVPGSTQ